MRSLGESEARGELGLLVGGTTLAVLLPTHRGLTLVAAALAVLLVAVTSRRLNSEWLLVAGLVPPWQYLPMIQARPALNPFPVLALAYALSRSLDGDVPRRSKWALVLLTLPAGQLLSAGYNGIVYRSLLFWCLPFAVLVSVVYFCPPRLAQLRRAFYLVGPPVALLTILEYVGVVSLTSLVGADDIARQYLESTTNVRALGPCGNPLVTSCLLLVCIAATIDTRVRVRRAVPLAMVEVLALLLTGSKSAVLGLVAIIAVALLRSGNRRLIATLLVVGAVLTAVGVRSAPALVDQALGRYQSFASLESADRDRAFTRDYVSARVAQHPFRGHAVGQVQLEKQLYSTVEGGSRYGIESSWLALAADQGVVPLSACGLALFIAALRRRAVWLVAAAAAVVFDLFTWNGVIGAWAVTAISAVVLASVLGVEDGDPDAHA